MHILTHDELPPTFNSKVSLLNLGVGWGVFDFDRVKLAREIGYPFTNYYAVYAVENAEPLAKVEAIHVELETLDGPETMCGIYSVLTRRDKSKSGLARSLIEEVHRREREAGMRFSILWTNRSNKAHNLYRSLGYFDIFDPPIALTRKWGEEGNNQTPKEGEIKLKLRSATIDDATLMDTIHSRVTAGRLGFAHRFKNFTKIMFHLGFEKPDSFQIFTKNDDPIGYAYFQQNPFEWIKCNEVVINQEYFGQAISLLEQEARGSWLAFGNSFVSDARGLMRKRGYEFLNNTYSTLMACNLNPQESMNEETMINLLGANDPRFACHGMDYF